MPRTFAPEIVIERTASIAVEPGVSIPKVPLPARWLLPNLCAIVFIITLAQALLLAGGHYLFRDSDTGWHIVSGQTILQTHAVPRTDPFSFTRNGREWFAWEWLSDVAMGAADRAGGLNAVAMLIAFAIALSVAAATALSLRLGANFLAAAACGGLLMTVTSVHWLARPHVFEWLFAVCFLAIAELHRPGKRALWVLPIVAIAWANMHGSFLLGPAILLIYAVGRWTQFRPLSLAALLSLLGTFINPYGWRLHQHVIGYLRDDYLMDHIGEFRSLDFHLPGAWAVEVFLLVGVAGAVFAFRRRDWPMVMLAGLLLHLGLFSTRHLPLAALLLAPLAIAHLSRDWQSDYTTRLRQFDRQIVGAIPAVVAVGLMALPAIPRGFDPNVFPVQAAASLSGNARIFATDQWGGYLIWRFGGRTKVFIDGRSDFYGKDFLERYGTVNDLRPGWEQVLASEGITHVLVSPQRPLAQALRMLPDWKVTYADAVAVVFERNTETRNACAGYGVPESASRRRVS